MGESLVVLLLTLMFNIGITLKGHTKVMAKVEFRLEEFGMNKERRRKRRSKARRKEEKTKAGKDIESLEVQGRKNKGHGHTLPFVMLNTTL